MAAEKDAFADLRLTPRLRTAAFILLGIVPLFLSLDLRYQHVRLPALLVFYGVNAVLALAAFLATFTRAGRQLLAVATAAFEDELHNRLDSAVPVASLRQFSITLTALRSAGCRADNTEGQPQ